MPVPYRLVAFAENPRLVDPRYAVGGIMSPWQMVIDIGDWDGVAE